MEGANFKYEMLNGRVRYVIGVKADAWVCECRPGEEPRMLNREHPVWSKGAEFHAHVNGLTIAAAWDMLHSFEDEQLPKRYAGGWKYEATVDYGGQKFDIVVHVLRRQITRITPRVLKFASQHAVDRAKERYDLVLDADTAEAMIAMLRAGKGVKLDGGMGGAEVVKINYDFETFTIVWSPETGKIITVTPVD